MALVGSGTGTHAGTGTNRDARRRNSICPYCLGIDTGGTYTEVRGAAGRRAGHPCHRKNALTTKHELSVGIREAIEEVLPTPPVEIGMVSLSTTLATNAVVEGQGSPVCALLLGYDPETLHDVGIERIVARDNIVFLQGGHTGTGEELEPLDMEGAEEAILRLVPRVSAFAISGFFGVRNPTHELRVRQLARDLTGLPGDSVRTRANDTPERAAPGADGCDECPAHSLAIRSCAYRSQHAAREGDSSPPDGGQGRRFPDGSGHGPGEACGGVLLSGPAASVVGACFLTDATDSFVIDMGGTTTDIAAMRQGQPVLNERGVRVGNWDIMVEAIDVRTTGLGGDSETVLDGAA